MLQAITPITNTMKNYCITPRRKTTEQAFGLSEKKADRPLALITQSCNPSDEQAVVRRRKLRYLLNAAAELNPHGRVASCIRRASPRKSTVGIFNTPSGAVVKGAYRCGGIWECPICSLAYLSRRRDEMASAMTTALNRGLNLYFLTLTVSHKPGDRLADLRKSFGRARRLFMNRKAVTELRKSSSTFHRIRSIEVTHGSNGWHYHSHEVIITDQKISPRMQERMTAAWMNAAKDSGLSASLEHGISIEPVRSVEQISTYVANLTADYQGKASPIDVNAPRANDAAAEMIAIGKSAKNGNLTILQLLERARVEGGRWADLWAEFRTAMSGVGRIVFSRGLADDLGTEIMIDEEAAIQEEEATSHLLDIDAFDWNCVGRCHRTWEIFDEAERLDVAEAERKEGIRLIVAECVEADLARQRAREKIFSG